MNYTVILLGAYTECTSQKTPFVSYFKQQAQIAKRDNFVEFIDFFNGCKAATGKYKKYIENQYNKRLTENDWVLKAYYQALQNGQTTDNKGESIQNHIDYIENDKKYVEKQGYENNHYYDCGITRKGDIAEHPFDIKYKLYYYDIDQLEQGIIQAEQELIFVTTQPAITKQSQCNTGKSKRTIKESEIRNIFKQKLNNRKKQGTNLTEADIIISLLKIDRNTNKDYANIALIFFKSKFIEKEKTDFKHFQKKFYGLIGLKNGTDYKENKLLISKELQEEFQYLY